MYIQIIERLAGQVKASEMLQDVFDDSMLPPPVPPVPPHTAAIADGNNSFVEPGNK